MKNNNDNNVEKSSNSPISELTPFEKRAKALENGAYMMKIYQETSALVEKLESLKEFEGDLPVAFELIDNIADEAIAGLANDLEERFGVSA